MKEKRSYLMPLVVGVALCVLPQVLDPYYLNIAILTLMWAYLSTCWNIVGGFGGQHSYGHSIFFGIGAYAVAYLGTRFGVNPWLAAVAGFALAAGAGWFVGFVTFRFNMKATYFALVTIALAEAAVYVVSNISAIGGAKGIEIPVETDNLLRMQTGNLSFYFYMGVILNVGVLLLTLYLKRRRFFFNLMAVRDDDIGAASLGVNPVANQILAVVVSAALCSFAGVLYAQYLLYVNPIMFGSMVGVQIVLYALVGGEGRVWGPFIGAAVMVPLVEYSRGTLGTKFSGADLMIYGATMILVMMFMPGGIIGVVEGAKRRVLSLRRGNRRGLPPELEDDAAKLEVAAEGKGDAA